MAAAGTRRARALRPAAGGGGTVRSVADQRADPPQVGRNLDKHLRVPRVAITGGAGGKPSLRGVHEEGVAGQTIDRRHATVHKWSTTPHVSGELGDQQVTERWGTVRTAPATLA